jgi:hypothetical protein
VDRRLTTDSVRRSLGSLYRRDVRTAAGEDRILDEPERARLRPFVARAAAELGPGAHDIDAVVDKAMSTAMTTWAAFNPPGGQNGRYLSRDEIRAIKNQDADLGADTELVADRVRRRRTRPAAPRVELAEEIPGVSLEKNGDRYTIRATADVPHRTVIGLIIDGARIEMMRMPNGINTAMIRAPNGYGVEQVDIQLGPGDVSVTLQIVRDRQNTLTMSQARDHARAALVEHIKNVMLQDPMWTRSFGNTWEEALARGVMTGIDNFAIEGREGVEIHRLPDRYIFTGRGPLDLYTEVEVAKQDARILRTLIEID